MSYYINFLGALVAMNEGYVMLCYVVCIFSAFLTLHQSKIYWHSYNNHFLPYDSYFIIASEYLYLFIEIQGDPAGFPPRFVCRFWFQGLLFPGSNPMILLWMYSRFCYFYRVLLAVLGSLFCLNFSFWDAFLLAWRFSWRSLPVFSQVRILLCGSLSLQPRQLHLFLVGVWLPILGSAFRFPPLSVSCVLFPPSARCAF